MSAVVNLAAVRAAIGAPAPHMRAWLGNLEVCCAYARKIRTAHDAETAAIHFDAVTRGLRCWSDGGGPIDRNGADDLRERTEANNEQWELYRSTIWHLASLPAADRREATMKRNTIGRQWLRLGDEEDNDIYARLRDGCAQDDHLLPPSERLNRGA